VYDLGDNWEDDIRVEKILALDPARAYPVCIGGAQPCPPEDSGGPWRSMSLRRTRKPHREHRKTRSPGKAKDTADKFDPDGVNFLLRDLQSGWLRRFDEAK
jgi:Plasmid pRiA4b ORF-3-like protein